MLIPVLYLSLSIRDPNHVDDNVYNNHKHPAYAYRKFWLFQKWYLQTVVTQYFVNNKSEIWS